MGSTKWSNYANIGTFLLTIVILAVMVVPLLRNDDPNAAAQTTVESPTRSTMTAWAMPSLLALAVLGAGALNFAASRRRKEAAAADFNDVDDPGDDGTDYKPIARELDASSQRVLFVSSNGYPLLRTQSGIALHLQILSSVSTKLVYAKATLARREGFHGEIRKIDLESWDPDIISAMQMFSRMLEVKLDSQEAKLFMGPNVDIQGLIKLEENNTHKISNFQFVTYRECPDDPQVPQLRAKLHETETKLATLSKPPDDLHVELLLLQKGSTFRLEETFYFLKLKVSCDEDTGIKSLKLAVTIGSNVLVAHPMNDLSEWTVRTPFTSDVHPYKSFNKQLMTDVSLWDDLQRNGLKSGLVRDGWIGIRFGERKKEDISQIEVQVTKSKQREPTRFMFTTFPKGEDVHINDFPE
jgi:hypothetical protein